MRITPRRPQVAVVGDAKLEPADEKILLASDLGRLLVEAGCRVVTGGLGGVMAAAMQGARQASNYLDGDTIAVLPGFDPADADDSADIVLGTGMNLARNIVVANADAVVAVGGGAGTLSEIALAWQLRRPVIALIAEGWSKKLGGTRLDHRDRQRENPDDQIYTAGTPEEAVRLVIQLMPLYTKRVRNIG